MLPTSLGNSGGNTKTLALPIDLTGVEVIFLTDSLRMNESTTFEMELRDDEEALPYYRDLLLRLGSAYCELVDESRGPQVGPVTVFITEEMAWILRSKVRTGDVAIDGKTQIGHILLLKLYNLLLQFNTNFADYKPIDEPEIDDSITRLREWKRQQGVSDAPTTATSPDTDYTEY